MEPVKFKQANKVFGANQKEYLPLPAFTDSSQSNGGVITCWKLSWKEIFQLLKTRKIWLHQLTFGAPLQPQRPQVENPFLGTVKA